MEDVVAVGRDDQLGTRPRDPHVEPRKACQHHRVDPAAAHDRAIDHHHIAEQGDRPFEQGAQGPSVDAAEPRPAEVGADLAPQPFVLAENRDTGGQARTVISAAIGEVIGRGSTTDGGGQHRLDSN